MIKLKLIQAKSYYGIVKASEKEPYVFVKTESEAEKVLATGYFERCTEDDTAEEDEEDTPDYAELAKMTKAELLEYAKVNGISTEKCKTKADVLKVISVAFGGSPTMIELQEI